jgi:hypothetical protein
MRVISSVNSTLKSTFLDIFSSHTLTARRQKARQQDVMFAVEQTEMVEQKYPALGQTTRHKIPGKRDVMKSRRSIQMWNCTVQLLLLAVGLGDGISALTLHAMLVW